MINLGLENCDKTMKHETNTSQGSKERRLLLKRNTGRDKHSSITGL